MASGSSADYGTATAVLREELEAYKVNHKQVAKRKVISNAKKHKEAILKLFRDNDIEDAYLKEEFRQNIHDLLLLYNLNEITAAESVELTAEDREEIRADMAESVMQGELLVRLGQALSNIYRNNKEDKFSAGINDAFTAFSYTLCLIENFTHSSEDFCHAVARQQDVTGVLSGVLVDWKDAHINKELKGNVERLLLCRIVSTLCNIYLKDKESIREVLDPLDLVEKAQPFLNSNSDFIQVHALLLIAFAANEQQGELFLARPKVIKFFVSNLQSAVNEESGQISLSNDLLGNTTNMVDLARGIHRLAKNDANKKQLVEHGILSVLNSMLKSEKIDQINLALDIFFTLSFNEENKRSILEESEDILKNTAGDKRYNTHRSLSGLSFNLYGNLDGLKGRPKVGRFTVVDECVTEDEKHVMISYQHDSTPIVRKIKDDLQNKGIKVWIDYEKMDDNTLSSISEGIENAHTVLMCASQKYKDSDYCRLEAEYALRSKKRLVPLLMEPKYKADGWLGLLMGTKHYYDFSGRSPFDAQAQRLHKSLQKRLSKSEEGSMRPPSSHKLPPIPKQVLKLTDKQREFLTGVRSSAPEAFYSLIAQHVRSNDFLDKVIQVVEDVDCGGKTEEARDEDQ